ncbi:hypothetical protein FB45DRAFT_1036610 [Roridomyces roridus]|uniref:Uncharacterized protein n=1 Tax=Roridomyces roridus TaxID=1738132 RepID=A0AAD7B7J3_9AGAR|nr:hypothetical protein FB45DRAFT_1036610 [Roridomyces roridus]
MSTTRAKRKASASVKAQPPIPAKKAKATPPSAVPSEAKRPVGRPRKKSAPVASPVSEILVTSPQRASTSDSDVISTDYARERSLAPLDDDDEFPSPADLAAEALLGHAENEGEDSSGSDKEPSEDGADDDDDDSEEEEEDTTEYKPDFVVPVGDGAADTMSFKSTVDFDSFMQKIADEMDVRRRDLTIAYKLSTSGVKDLPLILTTPNHLLRLFKEARPKFKAHKKSKAKKQESIQWKANKKQNKTRKRDDDDEDGGGEESSDKTGPQYLRELEATLACKAHPGRFCFVAQNAEHIGLSAQKLSLWSLLLASKVHKSLTQPPALLDLPIELGSEAPKPSRRQQPPPPPPPPHFRPGPFPYAGAYYPPPYGHAPPPRPRPSHPSERGADGHWFNQYSDALTTHKIVRISQLAEEGKEEGLKLLQNLIPDIPVGTAKLILRYAIQDTAEIRSKRRG